VGQNGPPGKNSQPLTGAVFVLAAQALDSPQENTFTYGALVSGPTIYAYVGGNPVGLADPSGLDVFIGAHIAAFPFGNSTSPPSLHLSLQLQPNSPRDFTDLKGWTAGPGGSLKATLGGQPERPFPPFGNLFSSPNYPDDTSNRTPHRIRVPTPCGMTDTQFINSLIFAAGSYQNNRPYSLSPSAKNNTYNSNSYVAGVLTAAGASPPNLNIDPKRFQAPGYSLPLPLGSNADCTCRL
jgi:hypothetical protein